MEIERKKFQGVLNVLSFNRHFYVIGLTVLAVFVLSQWFIDWSSVLYWIVIVAFLYGLIMPLLVSAYVYDFSEYYNFDWLNKINRKKAEKLQIVNINAGFDETSFILKRKFPHANLKTFDFYDAKTHTEPAIVRARKVSSVYPNTQQITTHKIPLEDKSTDLVFLLSAAHEIRSNNEKIRFLKECRRICKPNGKIVMVEHLRDSPNFWAFSVGFTHFFSKKVWIKSFQKAGFSTIEETKFTAFMSVFTCQP